MSSFLDNKEEVIKLELTTYGKKLLAQGQFKPEFYAFFDDGIIYDNASPSEGQNEIQDRILDNMLTSKLMNIATEHISGGLGFSSTTSSYAPAWELNLLNGTHSYTPTLSSYETKYFTLSNINYTIELEKETNPLVFQNMSNYEFDNGKILSFKDDYILIDLQELNVDSGFKNFNIEIFAEDELLLDKLVQLKFYEKQSNIVDGILYTDDELPLSSKIMDFSKENSEFYLDILVDEEIDTQLIEGSVKILEDQVKGTYTSTFAGPVRDEC